MSLVKFRDLLVVSLHIHLHSLILHQWVHCLGVAAVYTNTISSVSSYLTIGWNRIC